jgi:DNA mismatch repair protein MutH
MKGINPMKYDVLYDPTDPKSIEAYAQRLVGHTFFEVMQWSIPSVVSEASASYGNSSRKGGLGNLLEEMYFGYKANSISEADFEEAGVELKATPYEKNKEGLLRAGERLVLTMINYDRPVDENFYTSHLWKKNQLILIIYYLRNKLLQNNLLYSIDYVKLFTPPKSDLEIIIHDYEIITEKIKAGKAHELSESDTMYLGACTKGSTAIKSTVPQYYPPQIPARKRAFCYKVSYMTFVLNNYIASNKATYEPIIKNPEELEKTTFIDYVTSTINQYTGKTDIELCDLFGREYNNNKSQWIELTYRMLGIKSNRAEEFAKANITVKAIRLEENGTMRESSPLPTIKFKELVKEEWEDSSLFSYFDETKFLFVVYKREGSTYKLKGCQMWNMPYHDLNLIVKSGWEQVRKIVKEGLVFTRKKTKNDIIICNNLPSKSANPIIHVRPHTPKRFYQFENSEVLGNGSFTDADELPDGRWMPKQSFWINNNYIIEQLPSHLK